MSLYIYASVAIGVLLGVTGYLLGLFDRVTFEHKDHLLSNNKELIALVVNCSEKGIGQHVGRLLQASKKAVDEAHDWSINMQADAAASYGAASSESLSVSLYYDDPSKVDQPRWAVGWCVAVDDFDEAAKKANQAKTCEEEIVAVRLGPGPILTGRVPWRTLTPAMGPMLHWGKAFCTFTKGGYKASGNSEKQGAVALEVYVMDYKKDKGSYIDYVVLHGDVQNVWNDVFPNAK
jgi:hypothetical protein